MIRIPNTLLVGVLAMAGATMIAAAPTQRVDRVADATADPGRTPADVTRDANRKPVETLRFLDLRLGSVVADYAAGSGYFTRLFSPLVGPQGHVYASVPAPLLHYPNIVTGIAGVQDYARLHPNVTVTLASSIDAARYPEKHDLFWIAQNYHDLHDPFMGPVDMAAFNRAVYAALKPGGEYVILDHVASPGSPSDVTDTLHRIEASVVRREVEVAGFRFVAASTILSNPADPHTAGVFDKSIQGRTDQFLLKFRRPR